MALGRHHRGGSGFLAVWLPGGWEPGAVRRAPRTRARARRPRPFDADGSLFKFLQEVHSCFFLQGAKMKGLRSAATRHARDDTDTSAHARR